jgi:DNA-binding IclR family transcriptional regulator
MSIGFFPEISAFSIENLYDPMVLMSSLPRRPAGTAAGKPVGATLNTVQLLRFAAEQRLPWSATEAARALGMNASTCFNTIQTLVSEAFLEADERTRRYTIGSALDSLARRLIARGPDLEPLRTQMQELADQYKVTATVWTRRSATQMELLQIASSNSALNIQMPVGQRLPLLVGGMGRLMALEGGLTRESREALFKSITWQRPLTLTAFMTQARQAQRSGVGVDDGYLNRSVLAIAVPVRSQPPGAPLDYVCSATMFREQHPREVLDRLALELQRLAKEMVERVA